MVMHSCIRQINKEQYDERVEKKIFLSFLKLIFFYQNLVSSVLVTTI